MDLYNFIPPSPTAGKMSSFNQMSVGMHTGAAQVSLPLFTLENPDLPLPIGLNYSSNGVKVDEIAPLTGMGWSLQAGGVITRIVRGKPDEKDVLHPAPAEMNVNSFALQEYLINAVEGDWDTEPDLYSFNFMGYSGQFIVTPDQQIHIMPYQKLQIKYFRKIDDVQFEITTPDGVVYSFGGASSSETTMMLNQRMQGPKDENQTSWYLNKVQHPSGADLTFTYDHDYRQLQIVGASQSVRRTGVGQFNCVDLVSGDDPRPVANRLDLRGRFLSSISSSCGKKVSFDVSFIRDEGGVIGYKLNGIQYLNEDDELIKSVILEYKEVLADNNFKPGLTVSPKAVNSRQFLDKVLVGRNNKYQEYDLDYYSPEKLPHRLSFAQDHWGYFNQRKNTQYVADVRNQYEAFKEFTGANRESKSVNYGMIKSIRYPTGGKETFYYEPNTYWGSEIIYKPVNEIPASVKGTGEWEAGETSEKFAVDHAQNVKFTIRVYNDENDEAKGNVGSAIIYDRYGKPVTSPLRALKYGETYQASAYLSPGEYYFVLTAMGGEKVTASGIVFNVSKPEVVHRNIPTGGMRVAKIERDFMVGNGTSAYYKYSKHDSENSSAVRGPEPLYVKVAEIPKDGNACALYTLGSNSVNSQYLNNSPVLYRHVTVSRTEDFREYGIEEYEYDIVSDTRGNQLFGDIIVDAPFTNHSWRSGRLRFHRVYGLQGGRLRKLKEEETFYHEFDPQEELNNIQPVLYVTERYNPGPSNANCNYTCSKEDIFVFTGCGVKHNHILGALPFTNGWTCHAPGANNNMVLWESHCKTVGQQIRNYNCTDHLDAYRYNVITAWSYPEEKISREYTYEGDEETVLTSMTRLYHENPSHSFLTRQETTDSKGKTIEQQFYYPADYQDNVAEMKSLKEKFIIGQPVMTTQSVEGMVTQATVTLLNEAAKPDKVYQLQTDQPLDFSFSETKLLPTGFRELADLDYYKGQVRQVEQSGKATVTYIRDERNRVIAVVKNAGWDKVLYRNFEKYEDVAEDQRGNTSTAWMGDNGFKGSLSVKHPEEGVPYKLTYWELNGSEWKFNSSVISSSTTIGSGSTIIDEVRLIPAEASIQSFHYNSDWKISQVTDANQDRTYYSYDEQGRLLFVKDNQDNTVQRYEYQVLNEGPANP